MSDSYQAIFDAVRSRISSCDVGGAVDAVLRNTFGDAGHHASLAAQNFNCAADELMRPSAVYRPKIAVDGDQWCALYGDDLQSGVCGFGTSPAATMSDFDKNWYANLQTKEKS